MSEQAQPQERLPKWGDDISDERRAELDARLQAWAQETDHRERRGPFDRVSLTGADVFFLAASVIARSEDEFAFVLEHLRKPPEGERYDLSALHLERAILIFARLDGANLSGARLDGADLSDATLIDAKLIDTNLSGAFLSNATLTHADLRRATLDRAYLEHATLDRAYLEHATLTGANLRRAALTGADLTSATLTGTVLTVANLCGANLQSCRMDAATILTGVTIDSHTRLGDIVWNGAPLTQVDWSQAPRLGDENAIGKAETRDYRIRAIHAATRAYRGLTTALRSQSLALPASKYRLREQRLERRAARLERHYGAWLFSWLLDLVSGYGEEPGRIFTAYLVVVFGFAAAYMGVTHFLETGLSALRPDEALVLSLTSFHGRGFFPGFLQLGDWVARLGAAEAVIGLFIELILIATFSRRFLGN
jgi:uncharacterized protein YjbI with pentapeptide repeats